jgi:cytidylate kinase
LKDKGMDANVANLARELAERDRRDRERAASPLVPAADAVIIDTSNLGIKAVLAQVLDVVDNRLPQARPAASPS